MAAAQSGAAQQKWPLYNPRLGVPLLKRIHIVHTQADNIVLEPLWNLKKGKQVEIIEKILFGAEKIYVDLRNRSAEKDEFVRYADSFAYGDDFWRIVAKLVMPGIGGRKGEERAVVMNNARLHKIKVLSAGRVPKIKRKETVDKVRESFFEFCKNTGGFGTLQKRSFLIEIGYTIFAEGLNKSHLFEANAETAYQKIKDEFALRRGNPEAKFTMDKLRESFQECADLFSKIHCSRDLAILGRGVIGNLTADFYTTPQDLARFYQLEVVAVFAARYRQWVADEQARRVSERLQEEDFYACSPREEFNLHQAEQIAREAAGGKRMAGSPLYSEKASPICKRMLFEKENGEELIAEEKKETRSAGSVKMTSTSSSSSSSSSTGDDKEADGEMDVDEAEDGGKGGEKNEDVGGVKQENLTGHGLQLVPVRREGEQETEKDEEDDNARTRPPVPTSLLGGMLGAKLPKGWLLKALMPTLNGAIQWDERLSRAWHVALSIQRNLVADIEADQLTKIDHECAMMICRLMGKDLAAIKEQYDTDMMKLIMEPEAVNVRTARSLKEMALSDQLTSFVTNFEELRDLEILPPLVSNKLDVFFRQLDADRLFAQSNFGVDDGPAYQFYLVSNKSECDTKLLCGADAKDVLLRVGQIMSRATQYFMNFEQLSKAEWECFKAEVDWLKKSNQNERTLNRQTTNIKMQWLNKVGATAGAILAFLGGLRSTQDSAAGRRNVMNTVSVNKCAGVLPEIREMASMEKALKSDATLQREVLGKLNTLAAQCWRSAIVPYFIEVLRNMNSRPDDTVITGHRFAGFSIMDEKNGMRPITAAVNDCWGMDVNALDLDEECFSDVDANEVEGANEDDPDVLQDLEEEFNQNVDDIQV